MRRYLFAILSTLALLTSGAMAAPMGQALRYDTTQSAVRHAGYMDHGHRYHHRRWSHHHWHYY